LDCGGEDIRSHDLATQWGALEKVLGHEGRSRIGDGGDASNRKVTGGPCKACHLSLQTIPYAFLLV
jgi:hypothetical protein